MKPTTVQNLENGGEVFDGDTDDLYSSDQNSSSDDSYCKKNCPKFIYFKYDQRIKISKRYARTEVDVQAVNLRNVSDQAHILEPWRVSLYGMTVIYRLWPIVYEKCVLKHQKVTGTSYLNLHFN